MMDKRQLDQERRENVSERVLSGEPLIDPVVLETLQELDLPFRGEFRQGAIERLAAQVAERRTVNGIAQRISSNAVSPITTAIEQEMDQRVRKRIAERAKKMAQDRTEQ